MLKTSNGRVLVGIFVTIIVSALIVIQVAEHSAEEQSLVNYQNQIAACEAGNPVREAVLLAVNTAASVAAHGNARYAAAAQKIIDAPYTDDQTGARECRKAVQHP